MHDSGAYSGSLEMPIPLFMALRGASRDSLRDTIEGHLDRLRPALIADGGNVEFIGIDDAGTVRVALLGQCATCPAQRATLKFGLEEPLCEAVAEVTSLIAIEGA